MLAFLESALSYRYLILLGAVFTLCTYWVAGAEKAYPPARYLYTITEVVIAHDKVSFHLRDAGNSFDEVNDLFLCRPLKQDTG